MLNLAIYENLYTPGKFIFCRTTLRIHASIKNAPVSLCQTCKIGQCCKARCVEAKFSCFSFMCDIILYYILNNSYIVYV